MNLSGGSVLTRDRSPDVRRTVFSEYHAHGTNRGMFMLCDDQHKYGHYPAHPPRCSIAKPIQTNWQTSPLSRYTNTWSTDFTVGWKNEWIPTRRPITG